MTKVDTESLQLSPKTIKSCQYIADQARLLIGAESVFIQPTLTSELSVICSPYSSDFGLTNLDQIFAQSNSQSKDVMSGTTKYQEQRRQYIACKLYWPDDSEFGLLIMLEGNSHTFNQATYTSILFFKDSIEAHLSSEYHFLKSEQLSEQIKKRNDTRVKDIAALSYTLNEEREQRKAAEQEVEYLRYHDIGTSFFNQYALQTQLSTLLEKSCEAQQHVIVVNLMFSNGRKIQERYGDHALSQLLLTFRERIGNIDCIKSVTARTSIGNLVIAIQAEAITPFVDNFCYHCLEICHTNFMVDKDHVHLHGFIGVSTSMDSTDANDLIYFANEAAFASKDTGQKYSYYSQTHSEKRIQNNELESYLLQAVRNNDLKLYYQPKVSLKTGSWVGAEALIRWNHPILGTISNENLIQLAEQNGLIFEVGNFVLRSAIESALDWVAVDNDFKVAVNVSPVQLNSADFLGQVEHLLHTYQLSPQHLEIELTESCLISDQYNARRTLQQLHQLGVTLSLDDFGTGCASFSHLKNYPFNSLKIDKSFIQNLSKSTSDKAIVRSIVQIAKKLDLSVTIEGIEDIDQEQFVLDEGCDIAQGYFYGKPMSSKEFTDYITKSH